MTDAEYRNVPNGGVLRRLDSGLQIVRRTKHEWSPALAGLSGEALKYQTDKIRGSKFLPEWTLTRYIAWLEVEVKDLGWNIHTIAEEQTLNLPQPVGYSNGKLVTKIRIELSSRFVHAYPVGN